jgi:hypothetical protein
MNNIAASLANEKIYLDILGNKKPAKPYDLQVYVLR